MGGLTRDRAATILAGAVDVRVLVVGDLMLDRYISGSVDRISPEAPVPVVKVEDERWAVGGAGNVAANVTALGARCSVVGSVGNDTAGEELRQALQALGVDTGGVVVSGERPTTVKIRVLARRQQVVRVDREVEGDAPPELAVALADAVVRCCGSCQVLVLEDYNKGVLVPSVIAAALGAAERGGVPAVVDPKRRNFFAYAGADVFKPNAKELADALGDFIHPDDPTWMEETRRRLACRNLLLTLGEAGMARRVYDVSGAGDTVTAVMSVALGAGASMGEAAVLANHAAAVEVGKAGVATVSPEEILRHIEGPHEA